MSSLQKIEDRIRPRLRNPALLGLVALAALLVGHEFGRHHSSGFGAYRIVTWACALGVVVFGVGATRSLARQLGRVVAQRAGAARTTPLRLLIQIVGYLITLLAVLDVLGVDLSQFLVGGAVTGVVLGIAAQQSLGNFFAGLVLMFARPYAAGDRITVYSGAVNGPHRGMVTDVGLLYTVVETDGGPLHLPNSVLLASGVAPQRDPA